MLPFTVLGCGIPLLCSRGCPSLSWGRLMILAINLVGEFGFLEAFKRNSAGAVLLRCCSETEAFINNPMPILVNYNPTGPHQTKHLTGFGVWGLGFGVWGL